MTAPGIDPYRKAHTADAAIRFLKERDRHRRQADRMWLGAMAGLFSDHELRLLNDLGFLSQHDRDLLSQAGRETAEESDA